MKGFRAVVCEPGYSAYETEFRDAEDAVTQVVGEEYDLHFWTEQRVIKTQRKQRRRKAEFIMCGGSYRAPVGARYGQA